MNDYGLNILDLVLRSNDWGCEPCKESVKKHFLVNKEACKNWTCQGLAAKWRHTGHSEWEHLMSGWLLFAVQDAEKDGTEYADISILMETDLSASRDRTFTREQIRQHVSNVLEKAEETEDTVYWKVRSI